MFPRKIWVFVFELALVFVIDSSFLHPECGTALRLVRWGLRGTHVSHCLSLILPIICIGILRTDWMTIPKSNCFRFDFAMFPRKFCVFAFELALVFVIDSFLPQCLVPARALL